MDGQGATGKPHQAHQRRKPQHPLHPCPQGEDDQKGIAFRPNQKGWPDRGGISDLLQVTAFFKLTAEREKALKKEKSIQTKRKNEIIKTSVFDSLTFEGELFNITAVLHN